MAQIEQTQQHTQRQRVIQEASTGSLNPISLAMGVGFGLLIVVPVGAVILDQGFQRGDRFLQVLELAVLIPCYAAFIVWIASKALRAWHHRTFVVAGGEVVRVKPGRRYDHISAESVRAGIVGPEPLQDEGDFEPYDETPYTDEILKWHEKGLSPEGIANMLFLNVDKVKESIRNTTEVSEFEHSVLEKMRDNFNREQIAEQLGTTVHQVRKVMEKFKV